MATVLLGWELGAGLNHLNTLKSIADDLAARGHRPVLALKNLLTAKDALRDTLYPLLQAPLGPTKTPPEFTAASFADILAVSGWRDERALFALVSAWQTIIDVTQAKLVVCDHAPTLNLAAYRQLPLVLVGGGFCVPPCDGPSFPVLNSSAQPLMPESEVLSLVQSVQSSRGKPAPPTLPAIGAGAARFITSIRELDPYRDARQEPVGGPSDIHQPADASEAELDYFAYLSAGYHGVADGLLGLAARGWRGSAFIAGVSSEMREAVSSYGVKVYSTPPPLSEIVPRAKLILHHGGLATATTALMIGRPQVLLPRHLEQTLNAEALHELGVAEYLTGRLTPEQVAEVIGEVLENDGFMTKAQQFAVELARRTSLHTAESVADACCNLLE